MDDEKSEETREECTVSLCFSLGSQAQSKSKVGEKCKRKSTLNSRYSNLQDTQSTKVHQVSRP